MLRSWLALPRAAVRRVPAAAQQIRTFDVIHYRDVPRRKRRHRYRAEEKLINVVRREAANEGWDPAIVQRAADLFDRSSMGTYNANPRAMNQLNYYGTEMRDSRMQWTVEEFQNMTPLDRIRIGLEDRVLRRLLTLFVPPELWRTERTTEEQTRLRMEQWHRFQPESPGAEYSMDDLKEMLPEKDFEWVDDLRQNPPRGVMPDGWDTDVNDTGGLR